MEMECGFLVENFKNPKTIALLQEKIRRISDGSSPHCAGTLDLVLHKVFQFKKKSKGVRLRCSNGNCWWSKIIFAYASVESATYCPSCRRHLMVCCGCGYPRTSNYSSCRSCGKKFI